MCLTVDLELTREVRELLEEQGKVVVYKLPQLLPTANPERRSIRSETRQDFVWREGWNQAQGHEATPAMDGRGYPLHPIFSWHLRRQMKRWRKVEANLARVRQGASIGAGVIHAWLHKPREDDEYLMGLEGHADHFVAAGVFAGRSVQVAFTQLYLPMAELERVSKLEIRTPPAPDPAELAALNATVGQALTQQGKLMRVHPSSPLGGLFGGVI